MVTINNNCFYLGPNSSLFGPSYNNVESENDKLVDQLSTKVQALKSVGEIKSSDCLGTYSDS